MFLHNTAEFLKIACLFIKREFLYKVRTKLHIKITQHDDVYFNVLIQRKHRKTKNQFSKRNFRKCRIKAVLKKTMTTQEWCVKYDFVAPLRMSMLTILQRRSSVFIVNCEHISNFFLMLTLNRQTFACFILKSQTLLKTRSGISCFMLQYFKCEQNLLTNSI